MKNTLERQADTIEAVLAQHRIPARVTGGTVTPRWIRYDVLPALGTRIGAITGLAEELAAALDAPSVRVARQGAVIAVEVPRENPRPVRLLPLLRGMRNVPPATALLGIADDGAPLLIRLPSPNVAHVLVAGTTGSGKTALLRTIVLSLAYFNSPDSGLRLVLIDPKGSAFRDLEGLPHLARPVITTPEEATEALGSLVRLMEVRSRQKAPLSTRSLSPCILLIDELVDLMLIGGEEVERPLTRLLQRGREAGIHVIAATQKPTAAVIGSLIKANFPVRLCGKVASPEDARVATGWKGTGAERLMGKGDFIAVAEGRIHRFQAAYIAPEEVRELFQERWGNGHFPPSTFPPYGGNKEDDRRPAQVQDEIAVLAERLRPWWETHRGEWGAKSRAVRYLFGEDAPAGGHYWDLTMAAIARLEAETSTSTPPEETLL